MKIAKCKFAALIIRNKNSKFDSLKKWQVSKFAFCFQIHFKSNLLFSRKMIKSGDFRKKNT